MLLFSFLPGIFIVDGPETMHSNVTVSKCVGESAVINCSATGQPLPDIFLYHNGVFVTRNSSSLSYHIQVDASKFGTYMCISNNTLGTVSVTTTVNAKGMFIDLSSDYG